MRPDPTPLPGDRDRRPFSNGTMGEIWTANHCGQGCLEDSFYGAAERDEGDVNCPLITLSMINVWPREWEFETVMTEHGAYELVGDCSEFRDTEPVATEPGVIAVDLFGVFNEEPPARSSVA